MPMIDKPIDKSFSKNSSKGIKCFECQGYGHIAAKCANRVERRLERALNVTWDDDSEEEKSESESISECGGKFIAFMSRPSKISSIQGSSDRFACQNIHSLAKLALKYDYIYEHNRPMGRDSNLSFEK